MEISVTPERLCSLGNLGSLGSLGNLGKFGILRRS